jgi:hypothetical protein
MRANFTARSRKTRNVLSSVTEDQDVDRDNSTAKTLADLRRAHKVIKEEHIRLHQDLLHSHDSVLCSKAEQEEAHLPQVIAALEQAEQAQIHKQEQQRQHQVHNASTTF